MLSKAAFDRASEALSRSDAARPKKTPEQIRAEIEAGMLPLPSTLDKIREARRWDMSDLPFDLGKPAYHGNGYDPDAAEAESRRQRRGR
jgi:hypothetical protein